MRRLLASLVAMVLIAAAVRAQSPLPSWADSWNGVHAWFDLGPSGVTCADMVAIAYRYDFQYSGSCGAQFRQGNPSFVTAIYQDGAQALGIAGCTGTTAEIAACNLAWWRANHPDWLLYQDNETLAPTQPLLSYSYQAVNADFTSAGYRAFRWSQIASVAAGVLQSIGYDNALLDNNFPDITDTNYVQAKGVYPNATPSNLLAPPFNSLFVGQTSYADVLDPPFTMGRIQWFAYLRDQMHALARPLLIITNTDPKIVFNSPSHRSALIAAVDGTLTQGGGLAPEYVGDSRQLWLGTLRYITDMNAAGKAVYMEMVQPGHRFEADLEPNWIRFNLASYLLAKGHAAALRLNSDENGKCPTCTDTAGLSWPVEFEATHNGTGISGAIGIGSPCGPMTQIAGPVGAEGGLYQREYTGGVVLANGSLTQTFAAPALPAGSWTYRDIYNAPVAPPLNVGPVIMAPFTAWNGHTMQRYTSDAAKILLKTGMAVDIRCSGGAVDSIPPVILAGPAASGITPTTASIQWQTNEVSTTQVDYGPTASYGASTAIDAALVQMHAAALIGLTPSTTYHYRVKSADAAGNLQVSSDYAFNTAIAPPAALQITTASLPDGTKGSDYGQTLAASGGNPGGGAGAGFAKKRAITLPHPNSDLTDFPGWVCRTVPEWRTVAMGGQVQSPVGDDLVFHNDLALATKLDYMTYRYNGATGEWCGRIRLPAYPAAADKVIYAAYGNPSISSSQENSTAAFGPHIIAHWSMDTLRDSTALSADLNTSPTPPTAAAALVQNGFTLGTGLWLRSAAALKLRQTGPMTFCLWAQFTGTLTETLLAALGNGANYGMYAGNVVASRPQFFVTQGTVLKTVTSATARNDGAWHLYCGGYTGSNVVFNIDGGAEQITGPAVTGALDVDPTPAMTWGNVLSLGANWCATCKVDETGLFDQWMGADYIAALYRASTNPNAVTVGPEIAGPGGGYVFSIVSGALPPGLALSGATISGNPTTAGSYLFTARVADGTATADKSFSITVNDVIGVETVALPDGVINQPYAQTFSTAGGTAPFSWSLLKGTLPPGLNLTPTGVATFKLGGTLSRAGFYVFTIRATDAAGAIEDHRYQMFVGSSSGISYSPLLISWDFASGSVAIKYSYDCQVYATAAANLAYTQTPAVAILPQSNALCLKLDSSTEPDVDVPAMKVSGIYLK